MNIFNRMVKGLARQYGASRTVDALEAYASAALLAAVYWIAASRAFRGADLTTCMVNGSNATWRIRMSGP